MPIFAGKKSKSKSSKSKSKSSRPKRSKSKSKPKNNCRNIVYLDNNGTTLICDKAAQVYQKWLKCYNPSSGSKTADSTKKMIEQAKFNMLKHCNTTSKDYTVIFTSGGTESNCFIIRSCVESYKAIVGKKPHLIISAVEHHSIIDCAETLEKYNQIELTKIQPTGYGQILPEKVKQAIRPNTCLVCVMYANNETGTINDIPAIHKITLEHKIPLHSDCVQVFGKTKIDLSKNSIESISVSFHKFYGPKGIGLLYIKNELINGYKLCAQINGSQQGGLRGGTENPAAIASAMTALQENFKSRSTKNKKHMTLRNKLIAELLKLLPEGKFEDYVKEQTPKNDMEIVFLGAPRQNKSMYLHNTLLVAFAKNKGDDFCNVKFRQYLDNHGVVVSVSSACLTKSDKASHVLSAMKAPPVIKRGVIRVSIGDNNTVGDINTLVSLIKKYIEKQ